jgi:hypothetical protein
MREESLERIYENSMDLIDADLLDGVITQEQYEQKVEYLNKWLASWLELIDKKSTTNGVNYE